MSSNSVIARVPLGGTTKQSSRFGKLKAPSLPRGWIATAHVAMTIIAKTHPKACRQQIDSGHLAAEMTFLIHREPGSGVSPVGARTWGFLSSYDR